MKTLVRLQKAFEHLVVLGILPKSSKTTKFPWILNNVCSKVVEFINKEIIFYFVTIHLIKQSEGAQFLMTGLFVLST